MARFWQSFSIWEVPCFKNSCLDWGKCASRRYRLLCIVPWTRWFFSKDILPIEYAEFHDRYEPRTLRILSKWSSFICNLFLAKMWTLMLVNAASQVFTVWIFLFVLYHTEWILLVQFTVLQDNIFNLFLFSLFVQTWVVDSVFATCFWQP